MRFPLPRWLARAHPPVAPVAPFRAVGDIHGRADLLARVLDRPGPPLVCVGDYIDRGPDSAGVLRMLAARPDITCLMGNHEEMLLAFLDAPDLAGPRWLHNGGVETLASFGISPAPGPQSVSALTEAAETLRAAMGEILLDWLRNLPSIWRSGNVAVVHAGADPARPLDAQTPETLHWGHPSFPGRRRRDAAWIVHGHVIVPEPRIQDGVVSIDTGAWATDRLTIVHVSIGGDIQFETAKPSFSTVSHAKHAQT